VNAPWSKPHLGLAIDNPLQFHQAFLDKAGQFLGAKTHLQFSTKLSSLPMTPFPPVLFGQGYIQGAKK
jgi:hypothetical protein